MVISENCMNCAYTAKANGELKASNNTALEQRTNRSSTSFQMLLMRASNAGGSAIYRNLQSSKSCSEIIVNSIRRCENSVLRKRYVSEICLADVKVEGRSRLSSVQFIYNYTSCRQRKMLSYVLINNYFCYIKRT